MKKIIFLLSFIAFASACSSEQPKEKEDSLASCKRGVNPNGDSELAILMREMAAWTDSCKTAVLSHRETPAEPAQLINIKLQKKTDSTIDNALFNAGADVYLQKVSSFKALGIDMNERTDAYTDMVQACISCHENFCHGPIKRIKKLLLEEL